MAALDELELAESTLVIFTSDNGGVGGYQREGIEAKDITDNAPLRGGKGMLYEGGIRVPFVFRWKGKVAPGGTCRVPINSVDLYPTLLEVAGAAPPADYPLDGKSIAGLIASPNDATIKHANLYWHFPGYLGSGGDTWRTLPAGALRAGDWKLIEFFEDGRLELYNLADDAGERDNLAAKRPEKVAELHGMLTEWRKSVAAPMPIKNADRRAPAQDARAKKRRTAN
jgi:arylsulfatase A-like enzyme